MKLLKKRLKNGMVVIMEPRELPVISASISNRFGASFETSEHKGIAHFIEHLAFKGTKTRSALDISRAIESRGGNVNAFTAHEVTSFWFKLPSQHIFTGLDIMQDILNNSQFDLDSFEKEKNVVIEELRMYQDDPVRHSFDMLFENLYGKPFGAGVCGSEKTIRALKRDFVRDYFHKHYAANQFIATFVGNADFGKVCSFLEKHFTKKVPVSKPQVIQWKHGHSVEKRSALDQAHFVMGMHAPFLGHADYYALEVLDAHLANGASSRLFMKIREELGLAYVISSMINAEQHYSYYSIYVGMQKAALKKVEQVILDEFAGIQQITQQDVLAAQERLIGQRYLSLEDSEKVMNELLFAELVGDAKNYYRYGEKVRAVKLDQVKKLAKDLVKNYSSAIVCPK